MCYIQLSLLGIPARVVIGNSLTLKYQREMYTPFLYRVTSMRWPMYR
jgi:precorrin-3B methylase